MNTRDEPHADPQKYRRLHVIVGDANLCEVATFLKVGTTAIVLAMIEDGFIDKDLSITAAGARDAHGVARPDVPRDGRASPTLGRCTAVEVQWEFLRLARKYADETGLEACGGDEIGDAGARPLGADADRARARPASSSTASSTGSRSGTCCARTSTATA